MDKTSTLKSFNLARELIASRGAFPTFEDWLDTMNEVSPESLICEEILKGIVVYKSETPPVGYVRAKKLSKTATLWTTPATKLALSKALRLYGKTVGKIAKYVSSYVHCRKASTFSLLNGMKVMVMPEGHPAVMDGLFYYRRSLGLTGRDSAVARIGFSLAQPPENETAAQRAEREASEGLFPTAGLVKGRGVPMDDSFFPKGVVIITSEIKRELQWPELTKQAIFWQPGDVMKSKVKTVISLQSILHILGKEAGSPEFAALAKKYFQYAKANPEKVLQLMAEAGEADWQEGDTEDLGRDKAFAALLSRLDITPWIAPSSANPILGRINKNISAKDLSLCPMTEDGCDVWAVYPTMLPFVMFSDSHLETQKIPEYSDNGYTLTDRLDPEDELSALFRFDGKARVPSRLARLAKLQATLPALDEDGNVILYLTRKLWEKTFVGPISEDLYAKRVQRLYAMAYRNPVGPDSGTKVVFRQLPSDMEDALGEGVYAVPMKEVFEKLWSRNQGGDLDDCFWLMMGPLADLAIRGVAWRDNMIAANADRRVAFVKEVQDQADGLEDKPLDELNRMPKAKAILSQWYDTTVPSPVSEEGTLKDETVTGLIRRSQPQEEHLPKGLDEAEIISLQFDLHDKVFMLDENPFDKAVGIAANAQMFAMGIAIGWVQVPEEMREYAMDAVRGLLQARLSDIVDASVKGEGYAQAWIALREMQAVMMWLDRGFAESALEGFGIYPPLVKRAPSGIRAMVSEPAALYATGEFALDGYPVYREAKDERGFRITLRRSDEGSVYGRWDKILRRMTYVGPYEAWHAWSIWLQNWAETQIENAKIEEGFAWLTSLLSTEIGSDSTEDQLSRRVAHGAVMKHLLPATEEVKRRSALVDSWNLGNVRDYEEKKALSVWVHAPTREAWGTVSDTLRQWKPDMDQDMLENILLAIISNYLGRVTPTVVKKVNGQLKVLGGLPTVALFTDGKHAGKSFVGPWTAFRKVLARQAEAGNKFGDRVDLVVKVKWGADVSLEASAYMGKSIQEIMLVNGLSIHCENIAGAPAQASVVKGIGMVLSPNVVRDRLTRATSHSDKTAWEIADAKNITSRLEGFFPGKVVKAEVVTVERASKIAESKRKPGMSATFEQAFLVLSFGE
jgi:hypothetical protein